MLQYVVAFYLINFFSSVFQINVYKYQKGILLLHVISMWLSILGPTFTEENTLSFQTHILKNNFVPLSLVLASLVIAGISAGMFFEGGFKKNSVGQYVFFIVCIGSLVSYLLIVLIIIPVNVEQCSCLEGFYGESCENSCFGSNNLICSGHGTCSASGCACDTRFQGLTCDSCINEYNYDTNCEACNQGYSLTFSCTKCTQGRDPDENCQKCLNGYLEDESYNNAVDGCNVCKENYFKPSTDPRIGSYNKFLEYGEICATCTGNPVCNGHGVCNHFLLENNAGDFVYNGKTVLGNNADGQCVCETGFYGESCVKGLGFNLVDTESICNGNGFIIENYERNINDIFDRFTGLSCKCNDNWYPATTDDACSCLLNDAGNCIECAFGYYLENSVCKQCPGGSFTDACNVKNGGGVCQSDGTCNCRISYASGGYIGTDCSECANNNFFKQGSACIPCIDAVGSGFADSCNGHGVCITQKRLNYWNNNDDNTDSYDRYVFEVGASAKSKEELQSSIGTCECFENYANNVVGSCS